MFYIQKLFKQIKKCIAISTLTVYKLFSQLIIENKQKSSNYILVKS